MELRKAFCNGNSCLRHATHFPAKDEANLADKLRYFLHKVVTFQPCFPLKIVHLCPCCSNVSGYQSDWAAVTKLSQTNLVCQGEWTQFCNSRSQIQLVKGFFFLQENLASLQGLASLGTLYLLQDSKGRDACFLGALPLAR